MIPGPTIKKWVTDAGLTLAQAAELCDVSYRTIEYWRRRYCWFDHKAEPLRLAAEKAGGGR